MDTLVLILLTIILLPLFTVGILYHSVQNTSLGFTTYVNVNGGRAVMLMRGM